MVKDGYLDKGVLEDQMTGTRGNGEIVFYEAYQKFLLFTWIIIILFGHVISAIVFYYIIFHTRFWFLAIIYLIWLYTDFDTPEKGGRRSDTIGNWSGWKYINDYFPMSLETTCPLTPDRNYMLVGHPHGILFISGIMMFGNNLTDYKKNIPGFDLYMASLKLHFMFPVVRDLLMALGVIPATWKSLVHILNNSKKPTILGILPGGAEEALYSKPNTYRLNLKNKFGFIKLALMTGTSLVPAMNFGEVNIYDQMNNEPNTKIYKIQKLLLKLTGVAFCVFYGRGLYKNYLRILPYKVPIPIVVGKPIDVPKIENPTREEIQQYHKIYVEELKNVFYTNRHKYIKDYTNVDLIIE